MVKLFGGNANKEPVAKRKRFTTHPWPMLPHTIIDLQHAMTDVVHNGVKELVDDKGEEHMDDKLEEKDNLDNEGDHEEDNKEVESKETQFANKLLATELKSSCIDYNPGFNYYSQKLIH